MQEKVEPRFNPDSVRESVRDPLTTSYDDHLNGCKEPIGKPKGSGILLNLVLLILVVALGGMGWLLLEQKQAVEMMQQQVEQLEGRLQSRADETATTDTSLIDQFSELSADQEAAQQALAQNLDQDLKQLREALAIEVTERQRLQQTLSASIEQQQAELNQLTKVQAEQGQQTEQLDTFTSDLDALSQRQQQQIQTVTQLTESLTDQRDQLQSVERQLAERLESFQTDLSRLTAEATTASDNASELAVIEVSLSELREDVRAINNARQLINRDLLQLREQLNRVQLMLN